MKRWLLLAGLCAVGGFAAGRGTRPPAETVERVVYKDRIVREVQLVEAKAETRVVYRTRVVTAEGERRETEVERTETKSEARADTLTDTTREGTTYRKVSAPIPDWRVAALVGAHVPQFAPVYGAHVQRRILGPLSLGVGSLSEWSSRWR
jgi:hypothetical protein